jgi:hypothetical protein
MTKYILIIFLGISNVALFGQIKYASNGIRFKLPKGFKAIRSKGSDFATFTRGEALLLGFANGCDRYIERTDAKLSKDMTADLCFSILFIKMKAAEKTTWVSEPKDTVIHKFPCKWAEFHTTVDNQDYYMVYLLVKGKSHRYEIALSGHVANKKDDLKNLQKIMSSYREEKVTKGS